ncbi:DUF5693 family protein [Clostridiaceae bacterium 35-E11]
MKKNFIIYFLLIVALIATSITAGNRLFVEENNEVVDIALDYEEFQKMADQSTHDLSWWFDKMKEQGVSSVALNEESFESMIDEKKPLKVEMVGNIIKDMNWQKNYPEVLVKELIKNGIDEFDVAVTTHSKELYAFIKNGLESRYSAKKFKILAAENIFVFLLDGTVKDALYTQELNVTDSKGKPFKKESHLYSSKLVRLGLGLDPQKIQRIKTSDLKVIPRPHNYEDWSSSKLVQSVFTDYDKFNLKPSYMIFGGGEVLGYPKDVKILEQYIKKNNVKVGMVETSVQRGHLEQDGLYELVRNVDYHAIRVFSVWPYIQKRFQYYNYEGAEEIENTLYRAVTERNIRAIYLKPFKYDDRVYVTNAKEYEKMFMSFKERIAEHGMILGEAKVMAANHTRIRYKILIGWGIVAGALLLLRQMVSINEKIQYGLLGLGVLGVSGVFFILPSLADKLMALSAAIIFPSLGMIYFCNRTSRYYQQQTSKNHLLKVIGIGIKDLLIASSISFIGALMVGTLLSDIEYLLEMDIFRGVKISQIVPIMIYMLIYIVYFGYKRNKEEIKIRPTLKWEDIQRLMLDNVKIIYTVIAGIVLVAGYIYIARTGHETSIQALDIEMIFRNMLEEKLFARPRTKEFLVAFPALMVGVFAAYKRYKWLIFLSGLATILGQTSIVNTFSHLRTPMVLSFVRTIYSLGLGIILGIVYILILEGAVKVLKFMRGDKLDA